MPTVGILSIRSVGQIEIRRIRLLPVLIIVQLAAIGDSNLVIQLARIEHIEIKRTVVEDGEIIELCVFETKCVKG